MNMKTGEIVRNIGPIGIDKSKVSEIRIGTDRIEIILVEPSDTVAYQGPGTYKYIVIGQPSLVKLS